jgi:hypothetical protein
VVFNRFWASSTAWSWSGVTTIADVDSVNRGRFGDRSVMTALNSSSRL